MSKKTNGSVVLSKVASKAVTPSKPVVATQVPGVQRPEMKPTDRKINDVVFDTKVNIRPFYSKGKDKHYCMLTIGQAQDKQFLITMRKDGKGVCVLTDFAEYQYSKTSEMVSASC